MENVTANEVYGISDHFRAIRRSVEVRCVAVIGPEDECPSSGFYDCGHEGPLYRGLVDFGLRTGVRRVVSADLKTWYRF